MNLDKEKEEEIELKKKEARKRKLMEKGKVSRQEKKRKKKMEVRFLGFLTFYVCLEVLDVFGKNHDRVQIIFIILGVVFLGF